MGFIGHAHIERMLFEVDKDERRFVIMAFAFSTGKMRIVAYALPWITVGHGWRNT